MLRYLISIFILWYFSGCNAVKETSSQKMKSGIYKVSAYGSKRFYTVVKDSAFTMYPVEKLNKHFVTRADTNATYVMSVRKLPPGQYTTFSTTSFDFDVLTILFKYRPAHVGFPNQLNTNYNGALFLGYRSDYYRLSYEKDPIDKYHKNINHFGYSLGLFGGLGATTMNPSVTSNYLAYEYDGVVFTKGVTGLVAIGNLTFGLALGFDHLADTNRKHWMYQGKPWLGLTLGINLN